MIDFYNYEQPDFLDGERVTHYTIKEGSDWIERDSMVLTLQYIKDDAKSLGVHSVYTNENRRWDEVNGWQEPDKERFVYKAPEKGGEDG